MKYTVAIALILIMIGVGTNRLYAEDDGIFGETKKDTGPYLEDVDVGLRAVTSEEDYQGNTWDHETKHHYLANQTESEEDWHIFIPRGDYYYVRGSKFESGGHWLSPEYGSYWYGTYPSPHEQDLTLTWYPD